MKATEKELCEIVKSLGEAVIEDIDDTIDNCKKEMGPGLFRDGYIMGLQKMRQYTLHTLCRSFEIVKEED